MCALKFLVLFMGMIGFVISDPVVFNDCGSMYELQDVDIEGCNKNDTCFLAVGSLPKVKMTLKSNSISEKLYQEFHVVLRGVRVKMEITPEDLCSNDTHCPLSSDNIVTFTVEVNLDANLIVPLDGYISWVIENNDEEIIACMTSSIILYK